MLVKKHNGKWKACIDFSYLNKECPMDSFPLTKIDQLVDATEGHKLLSFMDTYSRYNHITIRPSDEESPLFITDSELYCYKAISIGLKNARATY